MRRYLVDSLKADDKRIDLDLIGGESISLKLNPLAGGMKQKVLDELEREDFLLIDLSEDNEILTKDNANKIRRIYLEKKLSNTIDLMYERM